MAPKVVFLMADYGHDPTETALPWRIFTEAGFKVQFATEKGKQPACDQRMLSGLTGLVLGAARPAKEAYQSLQKSSEFQKPISWTEKSTTLTDFDLVFLPGGHDKRVRQVMDSKRVHELIAEYFPLTRRPSKKSIAAICHGVQVLAASTYKDGRSVLSNVNTTGLLHYQEQGIYHATRLFLGDYYKTYGAGTPSVQEFVTGKLENPSQFKSSLSILPFLVEDSNYNYISARYFGETEQFSKRVVRMVKNASNSSKL